LEARKLKTVDDLLQSDDERVELINGEIVKRPMARSKHALIQSSQVGRATALSLLDVSIHCGNREQIKGKRRVGRVE